MSGGSFSYICYKDPVDLFECTEIIERMADTLAEMGYAPRAERETRKVLKEIEAFRGRMKEVSVGIGLDSGRLQKVWKAVEWWKSMDWGEDQVKLAVEEYDKEEGKRLISLKEHDNAVFNRKKKARQPHPNGIACPKCGEELLDRNDGMILTSSPPQMYILCSKCDYAGTRYV